MKGLSFLLVIILSIIISTEAKGGGGGGGQMYAPVAYYPSRPGGSKGSTCIIKSGRAISIDDSIELSKQVGINNGGLFIPSAFDDQDYEYDDEEEEESAPSEEEVYAPSPPPQQSYAPQYGSYGQYPYPMQYGGGMNPGWQSPYSPASEISVSSEPNFPRPVMYGSGEKEKIKYKRKRKEGGGKDKKKKGSNINCIIITRGGPKVVKAQAQKQEPIKLFGWLPITRRRRSIANNLRALKSQ